MQAEKRDALGGIWRLCEQMAYAAEHGHVATLRAEFDALRRRMARLEEMERRERTQEG